MEWRHSISSSWMYGWRHSISSAWINKKDIPSPPADRMNNNSISPGWTTTLPLIYLNCSKKTIPLPYLNGWTKRLYLLRLNGWTMTLLIYLNGSMMTLPLLDEWSYSISSTWMNELWHSYSSNDALWALPGTYIIQALHLNPNPKGELPAPFTFCTMHHSMHHCLPSLIIEVLSLI